MNITLQKRIRQLRPLHKNATEEELLALAKKSLEKTAKITQKQKEAQERVDELSSIFLLDEFKSKAEFDLAIRKYEQYAKQCTIRNLADSGKLKSIVILEVQFADLLKEINDIRKNPNAVLPAQLLDHLTSLLKEINHLKEEIFGSQDETPLNYVQILWKKFEYWRKENAISRQALCYHCSKVLFFKIRIDRYEQGTHPYLKDRLLINEEMFNDYLCGELSREKLARYLYCKPEYIDWVLDHHFNQENPLYKQFLARKKAEIEAAEK